MTQWTLLTSFFRKYTGKLILTLFVGTLSSITTILLPISIGKFYALVFHFEGKRSVLFDIFPTTLYDTVPHFILLFFVFITLNTIMNYLQRYLASSVGELLIYEIRNKLFKHQVKLGTKVYEEKGTGKYLLRYSGDLKSIQNYLTKGIIGFSTDLLLIGFIIVALASISPLITIISVTALLGMIIPISLLNQQLHTTSIKRRNKKAGLLSFVSQRLQSINTIKGFNRDLIEQNKFSKRSSSIYSVGLQFHHISSLIFILIPALLYSMIGLIMYAIYWQQNQGTIIDQEGLLAAFLLLMTMLPIFRRSLRIVQTWKLGKISMNKLLNVMSLPYEDQYEKPSIDIKKPSLQIKSVSFRYDDTVIFKGLSAQWNTNGLHLILGGTGSGKSCLAKLLLGMYSNYQGQILLAGKDISQYTIKSLRRHITIISHDFPLLGKTVFEAISYSRKEHKRLTAYNVLESLQLALPLSARLDLDDPIGNQGSKLSKGQKQVLLVARALLTKKPIILIDYPFSDTGSEIKKQVIQHIQKLRSKRTILLFSQQHIDTQLAYDTVTNLDDFQEHIHQKQSA